MSSARAFCPSRNADSMEQIPPSSIPWPCAAIALEKMKSNPARHMLRLTVWLIANSLLRASTPYADSSPVQVVVLLATRAQGTQSPQPLSLFHGAQLKAVVHLTHCACFYPRLA